MTCKLASHFTIPLPVLIYLTKCLINLRWYTLNPLNIPINLNLSYLIFLIQKGCNLNLLRFLKLNTGTTVIKLEYLFKNLPVKVRLNSTLNWSVWVVKDLLYRYKLTLYDKFKWYLNRLLMYPKYINFNINFNFNFWYLSNLILNQLQLKSNAFNVNTYKPFRFTVYFNDNTIPVCLLPTLLNTKFKRKGVVDLLKLRLFNFHRIMLPILPEKVICLNPPLINITYAQPTLNHKFNYKNFIFKSAKILLGFRRIWLKHRVFKLTFIRHLINFFNNPVISSSTTTLQAPQHVYKLHLRDQKLLFLSSFKPLNSMLGSLTLDLKTRQFKLNVSSLLTLKPIKSRLLYFLIKKVSKFSNLFNNSVFKSYPTLNRFRSSWLLNSTFQFTSNYSNLFISYQNLKNSNAAKFRYRSNLSIWASKVNLKRITWQRHEYLTLFRKRYYYQNQITRFILKFYRLKTHEFTLKFEFNLLWILLKSRLVYHKSTVLQLWKFRAFFINYSFVNVSNLKAYYSISLDFFDVFHLVVCAKVYIYLLWDKFVYLYKYKRFLFYTYKWRIRRFRPYPKESSYRIPNWILNVNFFKGSIPFFFEVDYVTLSVITLHYLMFNINYSVLSLLFISPIGSVRNHNWKSLT